MQRGEADPRKRKEVKEGDQRRGREGGGRIGVTLSLTPRVQVALPVPLEGERLPLSFSLFRR